MEHNKIRIILCGSVENSRDESYKDKVGVVSVVYVSDDENKIREQMETLQKNYPDNFYMEYEVPMNVTLTELEHYPSIEISKEDLQ